MMETERKALLVFQKNTSLGKVKSRLAATVGDERALDIYKDILLITYTEVSRLAAVEVIPFFSEYIEPLPVTLPNSPLGQVQHGADLGARMSNAFEWAFGKGYDHVGIIGTDCPELNYSTIEQGFAQLGNSDFSIGPAYDGGYYFLGMGAFHPWVFQDVSWSSSKVLTETVELIKGRRLSYSLLPVLRDVDTERDYLAFLEKNKN